MRSTVTPPPIDDSVDEPSQVEDPPHFDDPFAPLGADAPPDEPMGLDPAEPPPWLSPSDFYRMVLDSLPEGYRQHAPPARQVAPGPDLDKARPGTNPPPRPERVYLPPSSGLLRALYLAYGAFYPVDNVSVTQDLITNAPRYVHQAPLPTEPRDSMGTHYFRVSSTDKSSAARQQFRFAEGTDVLPGVPSIDPNTRFGKVPNLNLQSGFVDTLQTFLHDGERAFSYSDLCSQAAGELFQLQRTMELDDPRRPDLDRNIEMCLAQAVTCNKAAFVAVTKADCNITLAKRDAYLRTYEVSPSVQKRLRAQPFHGTSHLFAGNVRSIFPTLMDDVAPTVHVTCAIPQPGAPRPRQQDNRPRPRPKQPNVTQPSASQRRPDPPAARQQPAAPTNRSAQRPASSSAPNSGQQPLRGGRGRGYKKK